jgi:hypothetical protein
LCLEANGDQVLGTDTGQATVTGGVASIVENAIITGGPVDLPAPLGVLPLSACLSRRRVSPPVRSPAPLLSSTEIAGRDQASRGVDARLQRTWFLPFTFRHCALSDGSTVALASRCRIPNPVTFATAACRLISVTLFRRGWGLEPQARPAGHRAALATLDHCHSVVERRDQFGALLAEARGRTAQTLRQQPASARVMTTEPSSERHCGTAFSLRLYLRAAWASRVVVKLLDG